MLRAFGELEGHRPVIKHHIHDIGHAAEMELQAVEKEV
jgi:hypothetical protein